MAPSVRQIASDTPALLRRFWNISSATSPFVTAPNRDIANSAKCCAGTSSRIRFCATTETSVPAITGRSQAIRPRNSA